MQHKHYFRLGIEPRSIGIKTKFWIVNIQENLFTNILNNNKYVTSLFPHNRNAGNAQLSGYKSFIFFKISKSASP